MASAGTDAEKEAWRKTAEVNGVVLGSVDLNDGDDIRELYEMLGVTGVVVKSRLRAFISEQQQLHQDRNEQVNANFRSPTQRPTQRRGEPPSDGKPSAKRPRATNLPAPSADDNDPVSSRSALKYVATKVLNCSSSMIAMKVVGLLEDAIKTTDPDAAEDKYVTAAAYILKARKALEDNDMNEEDVKKNERFFTGAFCDALNALASDISSDSGVSFLHQGCIGHESTHSDFSARNVLSKTGSPTLLVGEGKANESSNVRHETRGQMFNELIRHRKIDSRLGFKIGARPVLLVAFNFGYIALDLAFPSKKGNFMEKKGWLTFQALQKDTETFWTIPVATVMYGKAEGIMKLPAVLRFIVNTLKYLLAMGEDFPRQPFESPFFVAPEIKICDGEKHGDNVTILHADEDTDTGMSGKRVYTEFCYYLRQQDGFNTCEDVVTSRNQRKPPAQELLNALGEPYTSWKVETGPFGIMILSYDYIDGRNWPTTRDSWIQVLMQVAIMHELNYVHGDLLPRNVIFSDNSGFVIDFDLTRKEDERYVNRYNHDDFAAFRHDGARAGAAMKKEHDVWSLKKMTETFFIAASSQLSTVSTINELIHVFTTEAWELRSPDEQIENSATSSPNGAASF